ncbi:hypothetical protein [Stieleria neptunia]|uniref:hypothetical protein n=1 Tax=Stieleria neptunia TaxID=2527979 RepID=UPI0011A4A531|nr:hypothetical protein [Stieleria neptunia]
MKPERPDPTENAPADVRVVRELGKGRAATARLVDATFRDGSTVRCVEKVFCPGRLTRAIYRIFFFAPFAYQFNRDAILACFYRRRVAAERLRRAGVDVDVAAPLYVRFDATAPGWVLAAEHIDGRGVRPTAPDQAAGEIDQLIGVMHDAKDALIRTGLNGSGWQVDPRALVSTANLLRRGQRYTIIDLESGIPAILVPKYWLLAAGQRTWPPFDDLDADTLRSQASDDGADVEALIDHTARWKASEPAPLRLDTWRRWAAKTLRHVSRSARATWHLLTRRRYQTYVGLRYIRRSIRRWEGEQRIGPLEASDLSRQVDANEVATYARGMALHLAIKACSPWVVPAKYGGVIAAVLTGNAWFLLPWLLLPLARAVVTLSSWLACGRSVRHTEALLWGCLPTVGSLAFPVQIFIRRPALAHFLIRDFASRIGRRLPIYGGKDSRTEMMLIRWSDRIVVAIAWVFKTDMSQQRVADHGATVGPSQLEHDALKHDALEHTTNRAA